VTDRGRKYSKASSAHGMRMRWKDTFNCFFGRRHTKRSVPARSLPFGVHRCEWFSVRWGCRDPVDLEGDEEEGGKKRRTKQR
jgi:hypothetical protein